MGGFRLAVGRVSLVHTLCYCQHRARGRRARLDAGGQRMPCKFSSPSHPVLLSAQGPGGAEHVEVQEAGGGAPHCRLNLLHARELISNIRTVSTVAFMAPGNDRSICQNRSECTICGLNLLHTSELISNCKTITATDCITPGNDESIFQNRSKGLFCRLNLLDTPELISNCRTVTAAVCMAPGNDCGISMTPQRKGTTCCCQWAVRHSPSSISASFKVCSKSTRTRFLAVISLRHFFPKARSAFFFTSWTVEEGRSDRSSACPFGKATFTFSIKLRRPPILMTLQNIRN